MSPRKRKPGKRRVRLTDAELLRKAIEHTRTDEGEPITHAAFADKYLLCNERSLRKYLAGRRLPPLARRLCERIIEKATGIPPLTEEPVSAG